MKKTFIFLAFLALAWLPTEHLKAQNTITVHNAHTGKTEQIEMPVGLTLNEDSLLNEWKAKNYLEADADCEDPDYNPEYPQEIYKDRLLRLPTVVEMTYNDIVQKFIDRYTGQERRLVSAMLGAANFYVPIFEEALDYYGLPLELKYLPVVESALNPNAVSSAGASGLWQFMTTTAKQYGLAINSRIDERRDPIKSSWAAAKILRDYFTIYGDWHLVLAAYNCGPGNVNKALHRAEGSRNYWDIYPYLPAETRGYVPAFIAANYVMNYHCVHNICPMKTLQPLLSDTIAVQQNIDLRHVSEMCGIDLDYLKSLNPQYRTNLVPGLAGKCILRLPQDAIAKYINNEARLTGEEGAAFIKAHNDQLLDPRNAAAQYGNKDTGTFDADALPAADPKTETKRKTTIKTAVKETESAKKIRVAKDKKKGKNSQKTRYKKKVKPKTKSATVRQGDTLERIAKRNGTTVEKLRKLNKIKGSIIQPGDKVRVK